MPSPNFQFKQFTVWHDRCAMKVGTDGVLLGAWCTVEGAQTVLDIGTGSGVIALMLAQRNLQARIVGIDIDADAVAQANDNFVRSPFASRLTALQMDFASPSTLHASPFSLIVSNPPFFTEDTASPDPRRQQARSASSLPLDVLMEGVAALLADDGRFALVVPYTSAADVVLAAATHGLNLCRRCDVRGGERKPPKRVLLEFTRRTVVTQFSSLVIGSPDYQLLTRDFYLDHP